MADKDKVDPSATEAAVEPHGSDKSSKALAPQDELT